MHNYSHRTYQNFKIKIKILFLNFAFLVLTCKNNFLDTII